LPFHARPPRPHLLGDLAMGSREGSTALLGDLLASAKRFGRPTPADSSDETVVRTRQRGDLRHNRQAESDRSTQARFHASDGRDLIGNPTLWAHGIVFAMVQAGNLLGAETLFSQAGLIPPR
jgi:hypothetical protein